MSNIRNRSGWFVAAAAAVVICLSSAPAWGQPTTAIVIVDENGNGTVNGSPLISTIVADPTTGGGSSVLAYGIFPGTIVPGDVVLTENTDPTDVLRFVVSGTSPIGVLFFYSDQDGGIDTLADNAGLPSIVAPGTAVRTPEVALAGGGAGLVYTPTSNQPGFIPGVDTTYTFISDVPEPGTLVLLVPAAALALWRRRSRAGARTV